MKKEASPLVFLASAAALMGAVSIGVTIGYTSPALPSLANDTTKMNIPTTDTDLRGNYSGLIIFNQTASNDSI